MKLLASFEIDATAIALHFLPNGEALLIGTTENTISVRELPSLKERTLIDSGLKRLRGFALHPNRNLLAAYGQGDFPAERNDMLRVLRFPDGHLMSDFPSTHEYITAATFSPDGTRLLAAGWRAVLWIFHLDSGLIEYGCTTNDSTTSIVFHPDGHNLLFTPCAQEGSAIDFAELGDRLVTGRLPYIEIPYPSTTPAAFSPDGRHFAFADRLARLYSYPDCKRLFCFDAQGRAYNPTKRDEEREREQLRHQPKPSRAFEWSNPVFTRDSKLLICDSPDGHIFFWDVATGALVESLPGHTGWPRLVALSPDGRLLASTGEDKILRLWQLDD